MIFTVIILVPYVHFSGWNLLRYVDHSLED
jgi:hypothetical protein